MLELREKTKAVKAEMNELRTEKKEVNINTEESVKELLNDEQKAKLEEWQSLRKEKNELHKHHKKEIETPTRRKLSSAYLLRIKPQLRTF